MYEEPATTEPVSKKAKTAQRKAEEELAKKQAQEQAKTTEAEDKGALAAQWKAEEEATKRRC